MISYIQNYNYKMISMEVVLILFIAFCVIATSSVFYFGEKMKKLNREIYRNEVIIDEIKTENRIFENAIRKLKNKRNRLLRRNKKLSCLLSKDKVEDNCDNNNEDQETKTNGDI